VAAGWVDQGTGPGAPDPASGWAAAEDRAAGELVVAEPAGAGVLVRQEAVPACGIPVWPEAEAAVAEQGPALVARAVGAVLVVPEVEAEPVAGAEVVVLAAVAARGRALVAPVVGAEPVAGAEAAVDLEVAAEAEGPEPAEELDLQAGKARHPENG